MIRKVLFAIAAVLGLALVFIATRPATFHVERTIEIEAPPATPFALVNDFHLWSTWSPYEKLDPKMKKSFGGSASGRGTTYAWSGNEKAGEGTMTIDESTPPSRISIDLAFAKPFAASNVATFTFVPTLRGTKVTWAMDGRSDFKMKAASVFLDMDKLVGDEFARGLATMKGVAESASGGQAGEGAAGGKAVSPPGLAPRSPAIQ